MRSKNVFQVYNWPEGPWPLQIKERPRTVDFLRRKCGTCPLQGPNHNPRLSRFVLFLLVNGILSQEEGRHWVETRWHRYDGILSNYIERRVALLCLVRPQFLTAAEPAIQTQKSNRRYRKTLGIRRREMPLCENGKRVTVEVGSHVVFGGGVLGMGRGLE